MKTEMNEENQARWIAGLNAFAGICKMVNELMTPEKRLKEMMEMPIMASDRDVLAACINMREASVKLLSEVNKSMVAIHGGKQNEK